MWKTGPYIWCARCGAHSRKVLRLLNAECRGVVKGSYCSIRDRLAEGRQPVFKAQDAEFLGAPERLTVNASLQFTAHQDGRILPGTASPDFSKIVGDAFAVQGITVESSCDPDDVGA